MTIQSSSKTVFSSNPYIILNNQGKILDPLELVASHHILGRDPQQADLIVPKHWREVSRCQAYFRQVGNDYYIHDGDGNKPSSNRLFINNTLITPKEGYRLQNGDEIKIGQNTKELVIITYYNPNTTLNLPPPTQRSISLKNRSVMLGRDPSANLQLEAPTVSRRHATIDTDAKGRYILQDHSTNGVFVNGQKVNGTGILSPGANIRIGPYTLVLQGDDLVLADRGNNIRLDAEKILRLVKDKNNQELRLLNNISLPIEPGQFVALVGGSGAGKSTLMRTLLGIEPTTEGTVYLNGENLRNNFNIYRTQIGYVPQNDIVHKDLRVGEVLAYAAKLRLPPDIDVEKVVQKTLEQIEMSDRRDTLVKKLSGGQLKRVSIGVELLADPKLFFLDEPTSGLDPGLDKKMMQLLRKLADEGRTVILVTHATNNITLCDRIAFLGKGGNLCYFGPPKEAIEFFQIKNGDFADIYINLETKEAVTQEADNFRKSNYQKNYIDNRLSIGIQESGASPKKVRRSPLQQLSILTQRYFKLILRDPINLGLAIFTAPIGVSLITIAVRDGDPLVLGPEDDPSLAASALRVLFVFTCAAIWVGLASSLQEIVKESHVYTRERLVNLGLFAYLSSKMLIMGGLALIQTILMSIVILIGFKSPESDLIPWFLGIGITSFLTLFTCMSLGLMVSASVKNSTQGNSAFPTLLLPLIIFSGVLFKMEGIGKYVSWLMLSRWSVGAYGILVNVNVMMPEPPEGSPYESTWENLALNWGILLLHAVVYLGVTFCLQKRKDII
ncbi:MAG: ATP-binding cassette domain-containing protein [Xenococcaceae cyanobacterium]